MDILEFYSGPIHFRNLLQLQFRRCAYFIWFLVMCQPGIVGTALSGQLETFQYGRRVQLENRRGQQICITLWILLI